MMSTVLKLGRNVFSWTSPETRKKLRRLALTPVAWSPYVAKKRKGLCKSRSDLTEGERAILAKMDYRISTADSMFNGDVERYFLVGLSALHAVENVLQKCPSLTVRSILDFPCGWGRVGRYLSARFPGTKITACDLMTDGVDFCAKKFGMMPVYSQLDFEKINLGQKYDLIWCGSLVTHLNAKDNPKLLRLFDRHLNDNGVVVFTTHGDYVADGVTAGTHPWFPIHRETAQKAVESYRTDGVAFISHPGQSAEEQYGYSITSPTWIRSQCRSFENWREVLFQPRGWDNFQDVYGYAKKPV
jgi:2-polyprenyl-3-methyl-5-hydroxy-6-metoxy-1,4-benzoquinol methylase